MYQYLWIILAGTMMAIPFPALAQMVSEPWSFQPQNRASIAALMRQVENENAQAVSATPSITTLVCGSDGKSSATGNSTCVILNNAAGNLNIGQDAQGDQSASSNTSETQNQSASSGGADSVLATLEGNSIN